MLEYLTKSGHIVDVVVVFMVIEALALAIYRRQTSLGPAPSDIAAMLLAGLFLLLALRAALTGESWLWILAFLAASLIAHIADLQRRWWT